MYTDGLIHAAKFMMRISEFRHINQRLELELINDYALQKPGKG